MLGDVNGLLTNDKFCLSRSARLTLAWSRYQVHLERQGRIGSGYLRDESFHRGGGHEARMADSAADGPVPGRPAALGPGLPAPPAMGRDGRRGAAHPSPNHRVARAGGEE